MSQETTSTNTEIAKAGIAQAEAEVPKGAADAAEPGTDAGQVKPPAENAFAAEDAELAQALEDQAKVEAGAKPGDKPAAAPEGAAAAPAPAQESAEDAAAKAAAAGHNATSAAFAALRKKNQELTGALLVKEGENRVLKTLVDPEKFAAEGGETGQEQQQPTIEDELKALDAERLRIAEEVDGGRMTMREHNQILNEIAARERAVTLAQAEEIARAQAQPSNDLGLQEHLQNVLLKTYPILNTLTAAQLKPFEQIAYDQAEAEGKPIQAGPLGTKDLRERMGALAMKVYGQPAPAAANNGAGTGAGPGETVRTQPNAAERENKLALAGNHPPDIGRTGSGNTGSEPTEAQALALLSSMDEDAGIRWLQANPGFAQKQIGSSVRLK